MAPPQALEKREIKEFRKSLTAVAGRLFAEHGYDGVTLRAISAELGCSPMTPYRYFSSKAEIFAAVRTAAYERFATAQEAAYASSPEPVPRLAALGSAFVRYATASPDAYQLMFELGQPSPDGYPALRQAEQRAWLPIRTAAGDAIDAGVLQGDADTVAHVFWAGVHGIVSLHLAGKLARGRELEQLEEPMLMTLLRGNLAEPEDPR